MDILLVYVLGNSEFDFLRGITKIVNNKLKVSVFLYLYTRSYFVTLYLHTNVVKPLSWICHCYRGKIIYEYRLYVTNNIYNYFGINVFGHTQARNHQDTGRIQVGCLKILNPI